MEEKELQHSVPQHKPTINLALIVSLSALFICFLSFVFMEVSVHLIYVTLVDNNISSTPKNFDK